MSKYLEGIQELIDEKVSLFGQSKSITNRNSLPSNEGYPLTDLQWLKIEDVICLFVDIRNSTGLSATAHENGTAAAYELFTGTAVRMFHELGAGYIDIKGDGVFAIFNQNHPHRAFVAAITFKTFVLEKFLPLVRRKFDGKVDVGFHMGIDQKTVLVKQIGLRDAAGRDRRKNEVWAGKPINMAAKLASRSKDTELLVSDRYYRNLSNDSHVQESCGCIIGSVGIHKPEGIWSSVNLVHETVFDFDTAYSMNNSWCSIHGEEWAEAILALDKEE